MPASGVEVTGRVRVRVERWRDELVASDPGGMRLFTAGRTVASLALALALGVLYTIMKLVGQPITVALFGVVISMLAASAVNDPDPHQQRVTVALLPLPAAASVALGTLLAGSRFVGAGVLVGIAFSATWARRFGPRGTALGMVAFMFFALFLGAQVGELPWLVLAIVVGAACSGLVRFAVVRDRPGWRLRRVLRSLRARITSVINVVLEVVAGGELDERRRRRLRQRMARLNEAALMVEDQLEQVEPGEVRYGAPPSTGTRRYAGWWGCTARRWPSAWASPRGSAW